ncbi:ABC transporter B family member 18 [Abeliophyllum distichum]|uniref:ABC transporter B family member 18 n=1 Tax=Abeliophyllum distichum TaxID=126358 RepID=A0ABD1SJT1_9LAMI
MKRNSSIRSIFIHADGFDILLMIMGFFGAAGDGISMPLMMLITAKLVNNFGSQNDYSNNNFTHTVNQNSLALCYLACAQWVACFLEGYCWTRTAERQASRLRTRYLRAVLRQDVGYFDLHVTTTAEVIASVSSDSLVIQDVISEKIPIFLMNLWSFVGAYIMAFLMLPRLAIVGLPFAVFLVIPGLIYGRSLVGISQKIRDEYSKTNTIVEQAISSIRTVYSFVGESRTNAEYSAALQGTVKLGLSQVDWSCITALKEVPSSQLVPAIAIGGLSLGSGLSNLKHFSEAIAAGERIMEVIKRVPKIDSDNKEGQILQNVMGEVEFKHIEFSYPSRPESIIFKDFNLRIPAGKDGGIGWRKWVWKVDSDCSIAEIL